MTSTRTPATTSVPSASQRLAAARVPSCRQAVTPGSWRAFMRCLDAPPPRTVDMVELLHPHTPPDDPAWPAPQYERDEYQYDELPPIQLQELMERLPCWQAAGCSVLALEHVLPVWAEVDERRDLDRIVGAPLQPDAAAGLLRGWLAGDPLPSAIAQRVLNAAGHVAAGRYTDPDVQIGECVWTAVVRLVQAVAGTGDRDIDPHQRLTEAVAHALWARVVAGSPRDWRETVPVYPRRARFDARRERLARVRLYQAWDRAAAAWWARCRCWLAVRTVAVDPAADTTQVA